MVLSMDRWMGKVAVVTGASAGIGAAIAIKLVEAGLMVAGLARRKEKLEELANKLHGKKGTFYPIVADIAKEEDILNAFKLIKDKLGPTSILINNAGVMRKTRMIEGDAKLWKETLDINVMGLCMATREAVKDMQANNLDGHIIHMNSIAGHANLKLPHFNMYAASKHAVTALTETLRQELNSVGNKIKITSISPGIVKSELYEAMFRESGEEMSKQTEEFLKTTPLLQTEDIADAVLYVLSTPSHVQIHEMIIRPVGENL